MSKVVHESSPKRYVIERGEPWREGTREWVDWAIGYSYSDLAEAIAESDDLAARHPDARYRVIDTLEDE